jgi:predicted esterase
MERILMRSPSITRCLALLLLVPCVASAQSTTLRHKLTPGDRLVYHEVFDKEGSSSEITFHSRWVFSSQLVVLDSAREQSLIGVQRNRQSADLIAYTDHGKDTLALQKAGFAQRVADRPVHFADANVFSSTGLALLPIQVLREANSKLLYRIGEVIVLPTAPVQVGSEWDAGSLRLTLERFEPVGDESCAVISDTGTRADTHLSFTFCPSGHLASLDFEGHYQEFESAIHEKVSLRLQGVTHNETPASWLSNRDTQLGILTAYLSSVSPLPDASVMDDILRNGYPDAQALALAAYYQHSQSPTKAVLESLKQSTDPEVRRIANEFTVAPARLGAQPCELPAVRRAPEKTGTTLRSMKAPGFANTPYILHVPIEYRGDQPFPLLIYLSGGSGLALDAGQSIRNALKHSGYLLLFPNAAGDHWWQPESTEMVAALLLEVLRTYNVDTNRVYLTGFSNGGTGTIEYATRWPDRFAAIASLMGAGLSSPSGTPLPLENLSNVPTLFLHGDKDPIIPSAASYTTYEALRGTKPRVTPEIHILKGRAHDITLNNDDDYTLPFLMRFTRDPFPQAVTAKFLDPRFPRQYWIEVVEGEKGKSEVVARILDGNLIDIDTKHVKKLRVLLRPELFKSLGPVRIRLNGNEQAPIDLKHDCELFHRSADASADPFLAYTDKVMLDVTH